MHEGSLLAQHENSSCPLVIVKHTGQHLLLLVGNVKIIIAWRSHTKLPFFLTLLYYYAEKKSTKSTLLDKFKFEWRHSPIVLISGWNADKKTEIVQCCFHILAIAFVNKMSEGWNFHFLNNIKFVIIFMSTYRGCSDHYPILVLYLTSINQHSKITSEARLATESPRSFSL